VLSVEVDTASGKMSNTTRQNRTEVKDFVPKITSLVK